jgi:hypothetical protein
MPAPVRDPRTTTAALLVDDFVDARRRGRVVGSRATSGAIRHGVDTEGVLSIDDGALRIRPLVTPGWGRSGLAYGPFEMRPGLVFAVHLLNGHHASQGYVLHHKMRVQLRSWLFGSFTKRWWKRAPRLLLDRRRDAPRRRVWSWWVSARRSEPLERDNLAVGWFPSSRPFDPQTDSAAFVIRTADWCNGDLMVTAAGDVRQVAEGIANVPLQIVAVARTDTAVLYAGSLSEIEAFAEYPMLRPLAVVPLAPRTPMFAGVHQCVLGEIGFSVDTRVYGARIAELDDHDRWCAGSLVADALLGRGPMRERSAERGGRWSLESGEIVLSDEGPVADAPGAIALLDPGAPVGLLRASVEGTSNGALVWRASDPTNHLRVEIWPTRWRLVSCMEGRDSCIAEGVSKGVGRRPLEVLDRGAEIRVALGAATLYSGRPTGLPGGQRIGLQSLTAGNLGFHHLEAHPRAVPVPSELRMASAEELVGKRVTIDEQFDGAAAELDGRQCATGPWRRTFGRGSFRVDGGANAHIVASPREPAPGRTIYTVPWIDDDFAELRTLIEPPSLGEGSVARCRAGLVHWQDADNALIVNVWTDDAFRPRASVSSFFLIDGHEDVYDAVWVNIGGRIRDEQPIELSVAFDGLRYQCRVDGETVLWRSLRDVYPRVAPLAIRRVGLVANWEWRTDTGSRFRWFQARTR